MPQKTKHTDGKKYEIEIVKAAQPIINSIPKLPNLDALFQAMGTVKIPVIEVDWAGLAKALDIVSIRSTELSEKIISANWHDFKNEYQDVLDRISTIALPVLSETYIPDDLVILNSSLEQVSVDLDVVEGEIESITPVAIEKYSSEAGQVEMDQFRENQKVTMSIIAALQEEVNDLKAQLTALLSTSTVSKNKKTSKRGPNSETRRKINELAKFRVDEIRRKGYVPKWLYCCHSVIIDPGTARDNAKSLRDNWKDINYQWSEDQENWAD